MKRQLAGLACLPLLWAHAGGPLLPVMHGAAAVTLLAVFPETGGAVAGLATLSGLGIAAVVVSAIGPDRSHLGGAIPAALLAVVLGAGMVLAQRSPPPSTHPDPAAGFDASTRQSAEFPFAYQGITVTLRPTLSFLSTSPDRFWTLFAGPSSASPQCAIDGDRTARALALDVRCALEDDVYSHLNTYATFDVRGHRALSVGFSPIPDATFPIGGPDEARTLAYVDASGTLRVVQASRAEKGPFTELGSGPLRVGEPLIVTLHDGDRVLEVRLDDFARHASTEASPTAGWGLPQNAIEFQSDGVLPSATVRFWITLAGTSVGRGFQSVGHAAGIYRNRIAVRAR